MDVAEFFSELRRMCKSSSDCAKCEYHGDRCDVLHDLHAADVAPVVRCKDCKHSTLPSELTQRYGKPGTLTCHNMHAPSNRRNVGSNDFCSYGARMDGDSDALD